MTTRSLLAILAALATGVAIALQAALNGRAGGAIGPVFAGLLINAIGGSMAIATVLIWLLAGRVGLVSSEGIGLSGSSVPTGQLFGWVALAGFLGILVVVGVSFSVGTVGVTAGLAAVILAQLVVALFLDRAGVAGFSVALDARRIAGVLAMAVGVWLLLPRGG